MKSEWVNHKWVSHKWVSETRVSECVDQWLIECENETQGRELVCVCLSEWVRGLVDDKSEWVRGWATNEWVSAWTSDWLSEWMRHKGGSESVCAWVCKPVSAEQHVGGREREWATCECVYQWMTWVRHKGKSEWATSEWERVWVSHEWVHVPLYDWVRERDTRKRVRVRGWVSECVREWITSVLIWFFCLIWFLTFHQQSFSYKGTDLPGLNQY